jgi:DMSO/TMAO reductase YedYZ molybdopterin-dependent catalytic subunit
VGTPRDLGLSAVTAPNRHPPKGQRALTYFPRVGLPRYVVRRVSVPAEPSLRIGGEVALPCELPLAELRSVPPRDQVSDLHCVITWSRLGLRWGGWALRDVYEQLIVPRARPSGNVRYLKFVGADGFYASLALDFALADGVLLADALDGEPLPLEHGAPLRLVAPAHYGYKSVKHLCAIELSSSYPSPFRGGGGLVAHRDALVEREQRGQLLPGFVYRRLYALIRPATLRASRGLTRKRAMGDS